MGCFNLRSLLLAAIVISNCITWTASKHSFTHNVSGHRRRHRRNGAGLTLISDYVIPGGEGSEAGWGQWGPFSECSRPCGGGVKNQTRICSTFGPDGMPNCSGGATKYYSCNTQDCADGAGDFRAEQCANYNDKVFKGRTYTWVPYTNGPRPCELNCMPKGERFYYRHAPKVIDGTRCNDESFDVCVNGECQPVGCDMMLGSSAREDKCRECRGNGSNCDTISSIYDNQELTQGYTDILLIPEGATNIVIEEIDKSNNYLALRSFEDNKYYLNGEYQISFPHTLQIAGARWHYERSVQGFAAPDKLRCLGPITEPLYLSLLTQETNVGIKYEYSIRKGLMPQTNAQYTWAQGDFTPCSVTCGTGFRTRNVTCHRREPFEEVEENLCDAALRPLANETCQLAECLPEWVPSPWSPCSKLCGEGSQSRTVQCQKIISNGYPSIVDENQCFIRLGDKPAEHQKCNTNGTCPTWFTGPWKPCDKLCGDGKQTRQVVCHRKTDGRVEVLVDESCEDEKPSSEQPCNIHPCDGIDWVVSNWTGCDSCLSVNYTREALCVTKDRQVVGKEQCSYHRMPALEKPCDDELPPCQSQWYASQWSTCSVDCGVGVKTRKVFCGTYVANHVEVVDDSKCDPEAKYNNTTPCEVPDELCPAKWFTADWSECTEECDGGLQFRKVMCLSGGNASNSCPETSIPDGEQPCNSKPCNIDELISVSSTTVMDDDDLPLCDEEDDEVGAELLTSTSLSDMMVSDAASTTTEGSGSSETEFDLTLSTVTGDFTETGSGESDSTFTTDSTTESETGSGATKETGTTDAGASSTTRLTDITTGSGEITVSGEGSTSASTGSVTGSSVSGETIPTGATGETSSSGAPGETTLSGAPRETSSSGAPGETSPSGTPGETTPSGAPGETTSSSTAGETASSGVSRETTTAETTSSGTPGETASSGAPGETTSSGTIGETTTSGTPLETSPSVTPGETTTAGSSASTDADTSSTSDASPTTPDETTAPSSSTSDSSTGSDSSDTTVTGEITPASSTDTGSTDSDTGSTTTEKSILKDATKAGEAPPSKPPTATSGDSGSSTAVSSRDGTSSTPTGDSSGTTPEGFTYDSSGSTTPKGTDSSTGSTPTGDTSGTTSSGDTTSTPGDVSGSTTPEGSSTSGPTGSTSTEDVTPSSSLSTAEGGSTTSSGSTTDGGSTTGSGSTTDRGSTTDGGSTTNGGSTTDGGSTTEGSTSSNTGASGTTTEAGTGSTSTGSEGTTPTGITSGSETTSESGDGSSTTDDGTTGSDTTTPWDLSSILSTNKPRCRPRNRPAKCTKSMFGCCPDKKTAAGGPFDEGCPTPTTCKDTTYGCCPDGVSPAGGPHNEECPVPKCEETLYGCCKSDNKTVAEGNDQEGCPPPCKASKYGCCADNETQATGPHKAGCPESTTTTTESMESTTDWGSSTETGSTETGSTETGSTETTTEGITETTTVGVCSIINGTEVCQPCSEFEHGCCEDGKTPAHGPNHLGCCLLSPHGCCPDNYQAASGPNPEDCDCKLSLFGCCPDNKSYASGANLTGCGCEHTPHGCCPDRHTEATGPKFKGCSCHTYQFGCCPDGETIAEGPNHQGCLCRDTPYGCCSDGVTPAKGLNQEGCDCASSKYGCCPDGVTTSQSDNFTGCADAPVNRQAACALSYDAGPCMNHSVQWYYDMQYGGCSRFHYGGCEGNGNRFADKAECEDVCVRPAARDACRLPKVKGSCGNSVLRWYYDSQYRGCVQFIYGSCLGNANNFESRELCEKQCAPKLNQEEKCQQAIERGPCAGNFTRWGYDEASGDCQEFLWGGCEGNSNRFTSKAACTLQCNPPGEKKPECQLATDAGNCTEMIPYWSFDGREERCVPIYYSGCGGNKNRFTSQEQCEASCPKSFEKDKCTLPASSGECRNYRERWFYDTKNQQCRMFPYGGCGGNANNFVSEAHCRVECARVTTPPPTLATPPTQPASGETPATCLLPTEPGACSGNELRFTYSTDFLECIPFTYTGCGGNGNNFRDKQSCEDTCRPPKDICELPKEVGPCRAAHRRWYYDTSSRRCEVFYFGGCRGNANNFPSVDECRSECELKRATTTPVPETPKDICTLPPKVGPCRAALPRWHYDAAAGRCERFIYGGCQANGNNFPSVRACEHRCAPPAPVTLAPTPAPVAAECRVSDISQCVGVGRVWYVEPGSGKCRAYDPAPGAARCEDPAVFPSPEACERACGEFKNLGDVCRLNMKEGSCNERQLKYYYDAASRTCLPFTYNGCSGSANRFSSASECENVCMPDPCKMPRAAGNCTESIESWSYDEATDECSSFYYTGCNGNANRYESQDECEGQCKTGVPPPAPSPAPAPATRATAPPQSQMSTDWCRLPVAKGNCNQFILKWYYDEARDSCERFVYTGCNGNDNSFSSKEDCEGLCKMGIEEPPTEPPVIEEQCRLLASLEPCGAAQIAFYYDYKKAACLSAPIGGCTNILNRYRTEEECLRSCGGFRGQDVCHAPLDPGPCRTARQKYYWNLREGRCEPYTYGGCEDPCKMPRAAGNCTESIESWSYDESTDECSSFYYTGCNGNANRYESQDECEGQCKTGVPPPAPSPAPAPATRATAPPQSQMSTDWCRLPVAKGNCNQFILKWYYDETRDSCERFVYTGCNGNDNSFSSKEDCEGLCKMGIEELPTEPPVIEEQCRLLASLEPCGAAQIAFYYDYKKDACLSAPIGGCTNILNRYRTEEECLRSCGDFRGKDVCHAPLDPGPCRTARQKYYWNLHEGRCEPYTYGGCEGGPNRFSNAEECQQICGHLAIDPACGLPPVPGAACAGAAAGGGGGTPRWHHSALYGDCRLFVYYGCGGNGNNFLTKQECERHCSPPPAGNGENEVDCEPARRKCEALRCEFGLTRTKDASGECDRCSCDPNPCADMQCRPGQRCHIVPYRATANGDLKSTSQCRSDCSAERARCESLECEYTVQRTRSPEGCERCECVRPEPNCQPFVDECNALKCNYGPITRTIDGDGCERCTCIAHPCEGKRCSEGQRCVVTASRNATSGEPQYSGDCGTVNKPGSCPVEQTPSGSCHIECNDDADCRGVQKCCHNGCSQLCRAPTPENHPTMSRAPQAPQPDPATEHEVSSSEGGTATLRCLFHSNPPPQITWKRGEITIDGSQGRYKLTSDGALQIVSLYRADSGVYICLAENELGATQQEIVLRVDVNVITSIRATQTALATGGRLDLSCDVDGHPEPKVYWTKDNQRLAESDRIYITPARLSITQLAEEDAGEYGCNADNGYTSHRSTVQISVQKLYIPEQCKDNQYFATCTLIVRSNLCRHEYYSKFCCKTCVEAGALNPLELEFQSDQSWTFKKK